MTSAARHPALPRAMMLAGVALMGFAAVSAAARVRRLGRGPGTDSIEPRSMPGTAADIHVGGGRTSR